MKNRAKFALFFLALILVNLPFNLQSTVASIPVMEGELTTSFFTNVLFSGAGISQYSNDDEAIEGRFSNFLDLSSIISFELPAIELYNKSGEKGISVKANENEHEISPEITASTESSYAIEKLDYSQSFHKGNPTVLIYHTHSTEAYLTAETATNNRSRNKDIGVQAIGNLIAKTLYLDYNIECIHITDVFDDPYNGAYDRSLKAIEKVLSEYPSIKYMFDVHRDGLTDLPQNRKAYSTTIDGKPAVKVATVLGTKAKYTKENMVFSQEIKAMMDTMYPTLYKRQIEIAYYYNQFIQPNSILLEVGSNFNTPEEGRYTAVLVGRTLGELIKAKE